MLFQDRESRSGNSGKRNAMTTSANPREAPNSKKVNDPETSVDPSLSQNTPVAEEEREEEVRTVVASSRPQPSPTPMSVPRTIPLLVCGIGNPGSTYANTLHSAGLTVLNRLADRLGYSHFQKDRNLGNGLVSRPAVSSESGDWTLWQSTSYMNDSGKGVKAAWSAWSRNNPDGEARLVVVYDELEKPLGAVTVRTNSGASAKGHNGLKSIMSVMGNTPFARIGIGIGRPVSRGSDDVARYVLKKMTPLEKQKIEECVDEVIAKLKQLEKG